MDGEVNALCEWAVSRWISWIFCAILRYLLVKHGMLGAHLQLVLAWQDVTSAQSPPFHILHAQGGSFSPPTTFNFFKL